MLDLGAGVRTFAVMLQSTPSTLKSRVLVQSFHFIIKSLLLGWVEYILFLTLLFKFTPFFVLQLSTVDHLKNFVNSFSKGPSGTIISQ